MGHTIRNQIGGDAADIKPKIVDDVKFWNVDPSNIKNWEIEYGNQLRRVYEIQNAKSIAETGRGLSRTEISKLRTHEDLGIWLYKGKEIKIQSGVGSFLTGSGRSKVTKLRFKLPDAKVKKKPSWISRSFLESKQSADRLFKTQIKNLNELEKHKNELQAVLDKGKAGYATERIYNNRLEKAHSKIKGVVEAAGTKYDPTNWKNYGWKPGQSEKNFWKWVRPGGDSYTRINEINKQLEAVLGFEFDVGHFWAALGPKGDRTLMDPLYAGRMATGGMFSAENIAPQPRTPSLKQLMHPYWSNMVPNVPGFYDKHGYQVGTLDELQNAYVGGVGWSGSLADYMMAPVERKDWEAAMKKQGYRIGKEGKAYKDVPGKEPAVKVYNSYENVNYQKISNLPDWQRAYVAFGDNTRAGVGATPEIRLSQIEQFQDFQPSFGGSQTEFSKYITREGYDQAAVIASQQRKVSKAARRGTVLNILKKGAIIAPVGAGLGVALGPGIVKASEQRQEENPNAVNWTQLQADRVALAGSSLSLASTPLLATPLAPIGAAGIALGETVDFAGGMTSLAIDVGRAAANPAKISTANRQRYRHGGSSRIRNLVGVQPPTDAF